MSLDDVELVAKICSGKADILTAQGSKNPIIEG